jgi:hypothetical protein
MYKKWIAVYKKEAFSLFYAILFLKSELFFEIL